MQFNNSTVIVEEKIYTWEKTNTKGRLSVFLLVSQDCFDFATTF